MSDGIERIYLAMGCFWGAEELYWQLAGVTGTSVGYMGGSTTHPTYQEVCTGATGHAETVLVDYDPSAISVLEILRVFWESHDPTQGNRQGNDIGTQYRSAIFWTTADQREWAERTREAFGREIGARGFPAITTEILDAAEHIYYPAEEYHQKYLLKNPNGYRCHATTGLLLPAIV